MVKKCEDCGEIAFSRKPLEAENLRKGILKTLRKKASNPSKIASGLGLPLQYVKWQLSLLEEKGLIEYNFATEKWHLKRR